jgi:type II secretory pathway pseudopilin PulG
MVKLNGSKGLSLLGLIIAVAMLSSALVIMSHTFIGRNRLVNRSRESLIATNLAREGLELVRAWRDTEWINSTGTSWADPLCAGDLIFALDARTSRESFSKLPAAEAEIFIASDGEWTHDPAGEVTDYRRRLAVDCSEIASDPARLTVSAEVTWLQEGTERTLVLRDQLFNWLP